MDGISRILEKKGGGLLCTRLYVLYSTLLTEVFLLFIYRTEETSEMSIIALFHSIGDHIPILKKEKFGQPNPEGIIASFHYRGTCMLIFGFTLMVTCTEWISGK